MPSLGRAAEAEYEALRNEIVGRNEFRHRMVELTLVSAGVILSAGLSIDDLAQVMFVYPVVVFFLAASWAHHGVGVLLAGDYLRTAFEDRSGGPGWESSWRRHRLARPFSLLAVVSSSGVFLTVQILTWGIGVTRFRYRPSDWVLAALGAAAIVATVLLMRFYAGLQVSMGERNGPAADQG